MIIQLVGLPCSGKSTIIKKISKDLPFQHLDIKNYRFKGGEQALINDIKPPLTIIESACGIWIQDSIVVLLKCSSKILTRNQKNRKLTQSSSEIERINSEIIPAHYTIYNTTDFKKIINIIRGT